MNLYLLPDVAVSKEDARAALKAAAWTRETVDEGKLRELAEYLVGLEATLDDVDLGILETQGTFPAREVFARARAALGTPELVVHNFAVATGGGMALGADGSLAGALAFVDEADEILWTTNRLGHDLVVRAGHRVRAYDVHRPERAGT